PELSVKNARRKLSLQCNFILNIEPSIINRTPYKMKCFISALFLIPVLLYQAQTACFRYKRESLILAKEKYSPDISFQAIDVATHLRETWPTSFASHAIRHSMIPFESILPSPLWAQRISGCLFPYKKKDFLYFQKTAKSF